MSASNLKIYFNQRLWAVLYLGFASGLPLALTGPTLQAWFTESKVNILTIGTLSLLGIPYTFKFLWAPLMDHFCFLKLGKRKGWILLTQLGLAAGLLILANLNPVYQTTPIGIIALTIAFFSASQDISINAYTTDVLEQKERGLGAAYSVFAYRIAMLVSGGLALVCADWLGWTITYEIMAGLMLLSMVFTYFSPHVHEFASTTNNLFATTKLAIISMFQHDKWMAIFLFILFYKFGDALALQLMTPFLLKGLGFSLTEVGLAYKLVSFIAMIIGGFVGGFFLVRLNLYRALLIFGVAQAFSNLTFVLLALVGKQFLLMTISIFIENFCSGLSTAALLAFMMSLCDDRYTASQFALLSAIASLGRVFLGPLAGLMVETIGWAQFFFWSFILCFPGIFFLLLLKRQAFEHAHATAK